MMLDNDKLDLLDKYFRGDLSPNERESLESMMKADATFRVAAEKHLEFLHSIENAAKRKELKETFEVIHSEMDILEASPRVVTPVAKSRSLWPMIAVAASVMLISVLTTVLTMKNFSETESKYMDLGRKVEQIQKSQKAQKAILDDIAKKPEVAPASYMGTGFMVSSSGYIATSYHVIKDADSVFIQNERFGSLKAKVVRTDQVNDVAILRIDDSSFDTKTLVPFVISEKQADLGEPVYTLGFPRDEIVYGEGTISAATGYRQNITAYQIAVPVNPGNSGGPLVNNKGAIVGMISGIQTATQGAAFAVKSDILLDVIKNIPDSVGNQIQLPRSNRLRSLDRVQQVKRLRDYVFVVKVYNQ